MNIAGIDYESVNDGEGVRTVVYVSGCSHNCYNCHNPQTHNINYGVPFTEELQSKIIENIKKRPFISGLTLSGGDPLHENNLDGVLNFLNIIRLLLPEKTIWLYSGYYFNQLFPSGNYKKWIEYSKIQRDKICKMRMIIAQCDVMVDGNYIDQLRNVQLKYRGSENQKVIDIKKTLEQDKIVLFCD